MFDTYDLPGYRMVARAPTLWECNWLQVKENSMDPAHLAFLHTLPGSEGFTEDLGALGEWDWMETPAGMVYIDTRRQGDRVWVRVADFIPPNIHQFPPNADPMAQAQQHQPAGRDDLGGAARRHPHDADRLLPSARGPARSRRGAGFGQDASRSYEERQRIPGDYDAQVSIHGGIARHGLEHLASTDRGVTMLRNMIRRGIRAVQRRRGSPPHRHGQREGHRDLWP